MKQLIIIFLFIPLLSLAQKTYVPDDIFENHLENNGLGDGIAGNDSVLTSSINSSPWLDVRISFIQDTIFDLTGIEDFSNITSLNCYGQQITTIDLSQNTMLEIIDLRYNPLTNLDLSQNTALTFLEISHTQISSLDINNNTALEKLYAYNANLSTIDVTQNTALYTLLLDYNQLSGYYDFSQHNSLNYLRLNGNNITGLSLKNTPGSSFGTQGHVLDLRGNDSLYCISVDDPVAAGTTWTYQNNILPSTYTQFSTDCQNEILGCTDPTMFNYNSLATISIPSFCIPYIYGCMDSTNWFYNPSANTDDGSCISCNNLNKLNINITGVTPNMTISWAMYELGTGSGVAFGGVTSYGEQWGDRACIEDNCYLFQKHCTPCNGWNNAIYTISDSLGLIIATGTLANGSGNYGFDTIQIGNSISCPIHGCTDTLACNYDSLASFDNNSCEYTSCAGCTDILACNYDSLATIDDTSCCYNDTHTQIEILCDSFTWYNGVTYYNSGIYNQYFMNSCGCDSIRVLDLTIHPKPVVSSITASPVNVVQSSPSQITVTMSNGVAPFTVSLSGDENPPSSAIFNITSGMSGSGPITPNYDVMQNPVNISVLSVTDSNGCSTANPITPTISTPVTVEPYPIINTEGPSNEFCKSNLPNLYFAIEAIQGTIPLNVYYMINGIIQPPAVINNIGTSNPINLDTSAFHFGANTINITGIQDALGNLCPVSLLPGQISQLIMYPNPEITIEQSVNNPLELVCNIVNPGTPPYTYDWRQLLIQLATTPTYTMTLNEPFGNFICLRIEDDNNCLSNFYCDSITISSIVSEINYTRDIIKITNILGQETTLKTNTPLLYHYSDGTIEKRITIQKD